ncbi:type I-E CRISPR-associated protein Cas6/Cse3/CasE [Streptomyces sp. H27-H1]|uniref:type I-E CRISPR-associated protein Cas6/Cse3/CasE n=1 Tax=Streptomyces sp. H27-H1 TaxID=2996461 RepID=UPI0022709A93|nr:type I-E CRISPR-associated protein Cas6/Cse3/CasE [Streptomyces sp. H27-H1]MCY0931656.1 type I-E CRISPR-associated protein Cas6/Cse3/CasE [Streptomyces sp. H27-H1]
MHLTRFRINAARLGGRSLLASPQRMHAAVMSSFAGALPSMPGVPGDSRVLWRVDRNAKAEVLLYIVSEERPDLTHLVEQAGWPTTATWDTYDYADFLRRLESGSTWAFRLTANPVHHIRRKDGEPTKRTAHVTPRHQMAWLLARQETSGFRVLETPPERRRLPQGDEFQLTVRDERRHRFEKSDERGDRRTQVPLVTVTFDGRLEVTDPVALARTLISGIGKAKAYGCGLMTLAKAG